MSEDKLNSKLNVAVVGGGFISQIAHIKNLKEIDHVNLVGLAELRPKQAELVASKFSISNIYKSHLELIEKCKPDLVYVVTRRHHTGPIALDLLNAGLNIFTEKPMAQTYEKSKLLVDVASKNKVSYSVGFMRRYDKGVRKAKAIFEKVIKDNSLGRVLSGRIFLSAGGDYCNISGDVQSGEPKPMDPIWPVAPEFLDEEMHKDYEHFVNVNGHDINLMRYFFGMPKKVEHCFFKSGTGAVCIFDYEDFPVTYTWSDTLQLTKWEEGLEINFEKGSIKVDLPPGFLMNVPATVKVKAWRSRNDIDVKEIHSDWTWSFKNEDYEVTKSILENKKTITSGDDSIKDMILIEDIWRKINERE